MSVGSEQVLAALDRLVAALRSADEARRQAGTRLFAPNGGDFSGPLASQIEGRLRGFVETEQGYLDTLARLRGSVTEISDQIFSLHRALDTFVTDVALRWNSPETPVMAPWFEIPT